MDKWKDEELARMRVGGNATAARFFDDHGDIHAGMSIPEKYNTRTAALYRDRIETLARGDSWVEERSPARSWVPPSPRVTATASPAAAPSSAGSDRFGNGMTKTEVASSRDRYFASRQEANASRPDHLPPSQGGKYGGFGSDGASHSMSRDDDVLSGALSSLSMGWATFSEGAQRVAAQASARATELGRAFSETVVTPASQKIADSEFWGSIGESVREMGTKAVAATTSGYNAMVGGGRSGGSAQRTPSSSALGGDDSAQGDFFAEYDAPPPSSGSRRSVASPVTPAPAPLTRSVSVASTGAMVEPVPVARQSSSSSGSKPKAKGAARSGSKSADADGWDDDWSKDW